MTDFVTRDDDNLGVGRILTSPTMYALYENLIATAQGAAGAPRIEDAALDATVTTAGTDWVLARNAGAATGVVGAYMIGWNSTTTNVAPGGTLAGSNIRVADTDLAPSVFETRSSSDASFPTNNSTTLSGTWRAMANCRGRRLSGGTYFWNPTLWLRIS